MGSLYTDIGVTVHGHCGQWARTHGSLGTDVASDDCGNVTKYTGLQSDKEVATVGQKQLVARGQRKKRREARGRSGERPDKEVAGGQRKKW